MSYLGVRSLLVGLAVCALFGATSKGVAQTVVYNLASDWSDVNNPNGVWALYKAPGQLFTINQANYSTGQPAWADDVPTNNAHVPVWMKVVDGGFAGFASAGTVIVHSAETARTGTEFTSVTWTSPAAGAAVIAGGAWGHKVFDRPQRWELRVNNLTLTQGDLVLADSFSQSAPFDFANGTSGASALNLTVQPNDVIELRVFRQSAATPGDFVGLNFSVSLTAIPEPGASALGIGGCALAAILGARARWQRSRKLPRA